MSSKQQIYGLFVGVNKYELTKIGGRKIDLRGCVNDVNLIASVLKDRYGLLDDNSLILTNENATQKNIIDGFRTHLAQASKGDIAVFYFSGHGSTERSDPRMWLKGQTTNRNETLVCHDSRASQPYDLSDKELRILIHELSEKGIQVVTIIDTCNSGDATRYIDPINSEEAVARQTPGSDEVRPLDSYFFYHEPAAKRWINDFSKMPEGSHIALSACRSDQLSKEVYFKSDKYGVFTHSLCQAIKRQQFAPSYRNLMDMATQRVTVKVDNQTPQLEAVGDGLSINQDFLASEIQPIVYSAQYHNGEWWLNAGAAQGINIKARLGLMDGGTLITEVEVVSVALPNSTDSRSQLVVIDNSATLDQKRQYAAQMIDPAIPKLPVNFIGDEAAVTALSNTLSTTDLRYYVEKASDHGVYELLTSGNQIKLTRRVGLPLSLKPVIGYEQNDPKELIALKLAAHLSQWEYTKSLAYSSEEHLIPDDLVSMVVEQQNLVDQTLVRLPESNHSFDAYYQQVPQKSDLVKPVLRLSVELNDSADWSHSEDVFFSLLLIDPVKASVSVLANKEALRRVERKDRDNQSSVLKPEKRSWTFEKTVGGIRKTEFTFSVPEVLLTSYNNTAGQTSDYLKLIISNFEIDVSTWAQGSLQKLLDKLNPEPTRGGNKSMDEDDEDDIPTLFIPKARTQTYTLNIIKPPISQPLDDTQAIRLSKQVRVLPSDLSALASLEYLKDNPDSATALRLELQGSMNKGLSATSTVSPNNPLMIEIASPPDAKTPESYLVFSEEDSGYDDDDFQIPLGFGKAANAGTTQIAINQLPSSVQGGDRSLSGSFLMLFKKIAHEKLNLEYDTARLAVPVFNSTTSLSVSDYMDDVATIKARVADAKKILLFVHGITGDTENMAGVVNREVDGQRLGEGYLVLTFDYENLSTPLQQTADVLRKKLEAVGLAGDHGKELVIIAHSMGGLVSRWLIEKDPARPALSKLIMLGTPNGGSPLRNVKKWIMVMLTLAANGISGGVAGASMGGLMFLLNRADDTLDEMADDSQTLKYLYEAPDPKVPYYMIAGNTAKLRTDINQQGSRINRLLSALKKHAWLGVTDLFSSGLFKEPNDVAVSFSSMKHIPAGRMHEMAFLEVDSDHLSYFDNKVSIKYLFDIT